MRRVVGAKSQISAFNASTLNVKATVEGKILTHCERGARLWRPEIIWAPPLQRYFCAKPQPLKYPSST